MTRRTEAKAAQRGWQDEHARGWQSAQALYQSLEAGHPLHPADHGSGLILGGDEREYAATECESYRFYGLDNAGYAQSTLVMGGPFMMAATGIASAMGNRSRRNAAELQAMPQWRYGGPTRAVLTSARLLILSEGQWVSFYLASIREMQPDPAHYSLAMTFEGCPPLALRGPWMPYMSLALFYLLHGRADPRAIAGA